MKLMRYLLSLYILILSCMPCVDTATQFSQNHADIHKAQQHESHADNCSPFCICMCCGSQMAFHYNTEISLTAVSNFSPSTQLPVYKDQFVSDNYASIWQPPKLSALI